ncbi:DUF4864 domain-containing protein [Fluoribacter dumoffii]|uniref:Predicted membrane protein n=1 Tax=Fluoribacter dumoffii TaxID=463 RepID=A0A377GDP3_9GAMM|nr:DUF4864 domain-containing protein [Fluoribacter dumoffii]KTC91219.1 TM2 domain protein [Fluoribacter dumoffii NY 23]MCW8387613.1 DUF4864 domain-containing protein [Fluoribacter dumoffii]MCW8416842.1 DUF4864 domain-containing protein [Fluoribacter dumoffii]MCW8455318.1 DUF4864 domain-containing protein [Fluoribacter dumoffii]MCW8460604.1 DUF4864 domain-containing protein [Fluoribacter dumoffii]
MDAPNFCKHCGNKLSADAQFCSQCGTQVEASSISPQIEQTFPGKEKQQKSPITAFVLALIFGTFGIHRFYLGKIKSGLLMLLTLGGLGIWYLVDLILLVTNKFEDKNGNLILFTKNPSPLKKTLMVIGVIAAWFLLFVGTVFTIVLFLTNSLIYPINNQLKALKTGNIEKAYSYTSKDFQKATSLGDFNKFLNQYPSLKSNESTFFNIRSIENNLGFVKGTLTAKDGAKTPIEYRLIWENGGWKILNIKVSSTGAGIDINHTAQSSSPTAPPPQLNWLNFDNKGNRYSLKYPNNWEYIKSGKGTVIFRGKKDTDASHTTITIQTLLTKKNKGKYSTIAELINDLKSQIFANTSESKVLAQGEIELPQNQKKFHGEYIVFTYKYKNKQLKQLFTIILRDDGLAFYTWSYTSLITEYDRNLPINKEMYESWTIY